MTDRRALVLALLAVMAMVASAEAVDYTDYWYCNSVEDFLDCRPYDPRTSLEDVYLNWGKAEGLPGLEGEIPIARRREALYLVCNSSLLATGPDRFIMAYTKWDVPDPWGQPRQAVLAQEFIVSQSGNEVAETSPSAGPGALRADAVSTLVEDFSTDPMGRGWYGDFDTPDTGSEVGPESPQATNTDAVSYVWCPDACAVRVQDARTSGLHGEENGEFKDQRRRYVRPIVPLGRASSFRAEIDFTVERFGSDHSNPMVLGLFNSEQTINRQSMMLQIYGPDVLRVALVGDGQDWITRSLWFVVSDGLKAGRCYRVVFDYAGENGRARRTKFQAELIDLKCSSVLSRVQESGSAEEGRLGLDEIGIALWDGNETATSLDNSYRYRLDRATLKTRTASPSGGIELLSPCEYQVVQRETKDRGQVLVSGLSEEGFDKLEARVTGQSFNLPHDRTWMELPYDRTTGRFSVVLPVRAGGWYGLEVRAWQDGRVKAGAEVRRFGVGEVFVVAGQSNSTNCGEAPTRQTSAMVSTFSGHDWRLADDPQPGVHDGTGSGSPWPAFLDAMYRRHQVPIGIAVTGHGGTRVESWMPDGPLFAWTLTRIKQLGTHGFRAVLWHQGESDAGVTSDDLYFQQMAQIIHSSNEEAGWVFPWFVAAVGVQNAQRKLWSEELALEGPDTDVLHGEVYRYQNGAHFTVKGLQVHGEMWAECVSRYLDTLLK